MQWFLNLSRGSEGQARRKSTVGSSKPPKTWLCLNYKQSASENVKCETTGTSRQSLWRVVILFIDSTAVAQSRQRKNECTPWLQRSQLRKEHFKGGIIFSLQSKYKQLDGIQNQLFIFHFFFFFKAEKKSPSQGMLADVLTTGHSYLLKTEVL